MPKSQRAKSLDKFHGKRLALRPNPKRKCAVCGGSIEGKYLRAKTCGDVCRKRLSRRRGHQEQRKWR